MAADPKVKIYGDDDPELTYTLTEELIKPDDIWGELERVPGEAVGVYPILQGTLESKNYDITYPGNFPYPARAADGDGPGQDKGIWRRQSQLTPGSNKLNARMKVKRFI